MTAVRCFHASLLVLAPCMHWPKDAALQPILFARCEALPLKDEIPPCLHVDEPPLTDRTSSNAIVTAVTVAQSC
eukprot:1056453-Lingulodinium_polyedra.AAC.1